jgi:hypothetical protein
MFFFLQVHPTPRTQAGWVFSRGSEPKVTKFLALTQILLLLLLLQAWLSCVKEASPALTKSWWPRRQAHGQKH